MSTRSAGARRSRSVSATPAAPAAASAAIAPPWRRSAGRDAAAAPPVSSRKGSSAWIASGTAMPWRRGVRLARDPWRGDGPLQRHFLGAEGAHAPSQLQLLVAAGTELAELRLAVRAEHVLGVDRLAAAGAGAQLAYGPSGLGQGQGLQLQGATLGHGQGRTDDHVDEEPEDGQQERDAGREDVEGQAWRALPGVPKCP